MNSKDYLSQAGIDYIYADTPFKAQHYALGTRRTRNGLPEVYCKHAPQAAGAAPVPEQGLEAGHGRASPVANYGQARRPDPGKIGG